MKCVIDGTTELESGRVCHRCELREAQRLADIVRMHAQLGAFLEPGTTAVQRVSGSREAPLPLLVDALDLAAPARVTALRPSWDPEQGRMRIYFEDQMGEIAVPSVLDSWVRDWISYSWCPSEHLPVPTVVRLAGWLTTWLPYAVKDHPALDEYSREINDLWYALRRTVGDMPAPPVRLWTPCRDCGQLALIRQPGEDRPIRCVNCRHDMTEDAYSQWSKLVHADATRAA